MGERIQGGGIMKPDEMTDEQLKAYLRREYGNDPRLWDDDDPATVEFFKRLETK